MSMRELSSESEIPPYAGILPNLIFEFRRLCGGCENTDMVQGGITDLFISQVRAHSWTRSLAGATLGAKVTYQLSRVKLLVSSFLSSIIESSQPRITPIELVSYPFAKL